MNLLMIIALLLGILVVIRLMNVTQLASALSGEDEEEEIKRHNTMNGIGMLLFMVLGLGLMVYMTFKYQPFMLPRSASVHGVQTDFLLKQFWQDSVTEALGNELSVRVLHKKDK